MAIFIEYKVRIFDGCGYEKITNMSSEDIKIMEKMVGERSVLWDFEIIGKGKIMEEVYIFEGKDKPIKKIIRKYGGSK